MKGKKTYASKQWAPESRRKRTFTEQRWEHQNTHSIMFLQLKEWIAMLSSYQNKLNSLKSKRLKQI